MNDRPTRRRVRALVASLCFAAGAAMAQPASVLDARLADIREVGRFIPERALPMLLKIEQQARAAPPATKAEFLIQLSMARRGVGQIQPALLLAEEVIALAREKDDKVVLAKGLLAKGYILFSMNELKLSHEVLWEGERIANQTDDLPLRIQAAISSGQGHAEDGNFPAALGKLQAAVALARQQGQPIQKVMALRALAVLYTQMKEFDKGFATLDEAVAMAEQANAPGRMAWLKNTEYGLAVDTGQYKRALKALLAGLEIERKIGADSMAAKSLVNLADIYLKQHDYRAALGYAQQATAAGIALRNESIEATGRVNIGQAYLGMGRVAEGKRSFDAGLAFYEKAGDKPSLQSVLMEYGSALERAGDLAGAVAAYHRERTLSNELFEKQRQKAVWELQEKYEADRRERQIELLSRENQIKSAEIDNRRLQQRVWWLLAAVFTLASVIVLILYRKVRQANQQLKMKNLELKQQSVRDPLTGLYNRRHFQEFMRDHQQGGEQRGAGTSGEEMVGALFLLDVDHFKHVNDTYGHAAGDAVLKMIAASLQDILRETDMIVRWGGEEFLAFLPAIPRNGIDEIARRLLTGISQQRIEYQGDEISVNVSIGCAPYPLAPGGEALSWERAVNLVDMALYMAKGHGRNRAYGVRGFANFPQTSMESIEQDLERAWRAGYVDLSVVLGGWREPKVVPEPALSAA